MDLVQIGLSDESNPASFVRPTRPRDYPRSFVSSLRAKYAGFVDVQDRDPSPEEEIRVSGKTVEEIGFEKIARQQAQLEELRIVVLDGQLIAAPEPHATTGRSVEDYIHQICPNIVELDLSRNLLETWLEVSNICRQLPALARLRLDGNRFHSFQAFDTVGIASNSLKSLSLDNTFVSWNDVCTL